MPVHKFSALRIEEMVLETKGANFVWMQDPWLLLKSDSIFMTKDIWEFSQFKDAVACREYIFPRDEETSEPKGWIRGNKIGPVLEVTTSCLQDKYGVGIGIESMDKDHSHSWTRISHGLNKLVTNLKNNDQETSEKQFEEFASRLNAGDFACRSKAKAKKKNDIMPAHPQELYLLGKNLDRS